VTTGLTVRDFSRIDGPLREYYLCGTYDTPDQAEWRTEIGWPIFRAEGSA
jgi:hypothetical protein